jgi:DNA-directed RNA polymerase specialized sigma subunit
LIEKAEMLDDIKTSNASLVQDERLMPLGALQRLVTSESMLRTWREYRGLTQTDLAKQVGVSQSAIFQIE